MDDVRTYRAVSLDRMAVWRSDRSFSSSGGAEASVAEELHRQCCVLSLLELANSLRSKMFMFTV